MIFSLKTVRDKKEMVLDDEKEYPPNLVRDFTFIPFP